MSRSSGLKLTTTRPTIITSPTNQKAGCRAPTARPPSSGTIGIRLNRFRKKPTNARATRSSEPVTSPAIQNAAAPTEPTIGPASATRASFQASSGSSFIPMTAPRKGMKSGALAGTPWRRSSITCPISWTKIRIDEPDRERQPPDPRVRRDRHQHRGAGRQYLELQEQAAELDDQETERDQRREELSHHVAESPTRLHGLVTASAVLRGLRVGKVGRLGCLDRLPAAIRIDAHDPLPIHSSPPS